MTQTRRLQVDEESVADQEKSCEDWSKLKMEVLKLNCNQYGLVSTGKKAEVQQRLMAHFRTNPTAIEDANTHVRVEDDDCILDELWALRSEVSAMKHKQQEMGRLMYHQSSQATSSETLVDGIHVIPTSNHRSVIPTIADMMENPIVISQDHHDNIQNIRPVHSFQLLPFMNNSSSVDNTGMFSSNFK